MSSKKELPKALTSIQPALPSLLSMNHRPPYIEDALSSSDPEDTGKSRGNSAGLHSQQSSKPTRESLERQLDKSKAKGASHLLPQLDDLTEENLANFETGQRTEGSIADSRAAELPSVPLTRENLQELERIHKAGSSVKHGSLSLAAKRDRSETPHELHLPGIGYLSIRKPGDTRSLDAHARAPLIAGGPGFQKSVEDLVSKISTDTSAPWISEFGDQVSEHRDCAQDKTHGFKRQSSVQSIVSSFESMRSRAFGAVASIFNIPERTRSLDLLIERPHAEDPHSSPDASTGVIETDEDDWRGEGSEPDTAADSEGSDSNHLFIWLDSGSAPNSQTTTPRRKVAISRAERLLEQRKSRDSDDPENLRMMDRLAALYRKRGDIKSAASVAQMAMETSSRAHGGNRPETLSLMHNYAVTLYDQGDLNAAESIQLKVLKKRREISGDRNPDTISAMINYAATLFKKKEFDAASNLQWEVCKRMAELVGEDDPNTISAMNNYAITLHSQRRLEEAEEMQEKILTRHRAVLGEDHEETVTAMVNYAIILLARDRIQEAVKFQEKVLEKREAAFGHHHPKTMRAMANYATMLERQGEAEKSASVRQALIARKAAKRQAKTKDRDNSKSQPEPKDNESTQRDHLDLSNNPGSRKQRSTGKIRDLAALGSGSTAISTTSGTGFGLDRAVLPVFAPLQESQSLDVSQVSGVWISGSYTWFGCRFRWQIQTISRKHKHLHFEVALMDDGIIHQTASRLQTGWHWLTEPRLDLQKKRVRWHCRCGQRLYDDFTELTPGSVEKLQKRLNERYSKRAGNANRSGPQGLINRFWRSTSSLLTNNSRRMIEKNNELPRFQTFSSLDTESHSNTPPKMTVSDLHLCIKQSGSYVPKLHALDIRTMLSDRELFHAMRTAHQQTRSPWMRRWSLQHLHAIRLVQFVLYRHANVGVRAMAPDPACIPPAARLVELRYDYTPAPPDYMPPIGDNELLHLYHHPEHAADEAAELLPLLPKKILEHLSVEAKTGRAVGWGLLFVEAWNPKRIWIAATLLFVVASLTFGVVWSVLEHDIQTAFAVAGYVTSFLTLLGGIVQVHLEPAD